VYDCEVEGTIPKDINGAFVRVGGSWFYPGKNGDTNPFLADGYISSFRFRNGIVDYKGRFVKTKRFLDNLKERRNVYGYYRNPTTNEPAYQNLDKPYLGTVSNTAPVAHAGKLFAVKEDAQPCEIDPNTLETLGAWISTVNSNPKPLRPIRSLILSAAK
jgi:carotenoid cleavage dioxygenase